MALHESVSRGWFTRPEVDPEHQDAVFYRALRVTHHGVVHEVDLGLLDEAAAFGSFDRWHATLTDSSSALAEPLDHGSDIQLLGHLRRLPGAVAGSRRSCSRACSKERAGTGMLFGVSGVGYGDCVGRSDPYALPVAAPRPGRVGCAGGRLERSCCPGLGTRPTEESL